MKYYWNLSPCFKEFVGIKFLLLARSQISRRLENALLTWQELVKLLEPVRRESLKEIPQKTRRNLFHEICLDNLESLPITLMLHHPEQFPTTRT